MRVIPVQFQSLYEQLGCTVCVGISVVTIKKKKSTYAWNVPRMFIKF